MGTDKQNSAVPERMPHVLLVDDDPLVLGAYARLLNASGCRVTRAADGLEALRLAEGDASFDLVISDIVMPDLDGLSFLQALRGRDADLPVVLLTGRPTISSAATAVEYGATRYLRKPIEWIDLHATVQQIMLTNEPRRHLREGARIAREESERILRLAFARALASLEMAYQPIVQAHSHVVFAHEALMRPSEPSLNNPKAMLNAAEALGRFPALGARTRELVASAASTHENGLFFVNLHPHDLLDDGLFDEKMPLTQVASRIVLELTERAPLDEVVDAVDRVARLRRLGFRIAIDDLGAGFAGLATLALVQPDFVKVDMSLVRAIDEDARRRKIVASLVALCTDMGVEVIAEGVETDGEREALVSCGCSLLQGYLFGRPRRSILPMLPEVRVRAITDGSR